MKILLWVLLFLDSMAVLFILSLKLDEYKLSSFGFNKYLEQFASKQVSLKKRLYKNIDIVETALLVKLTSLFAVLVAIFAHQVHPVLGVIYALLLLMALNLVSKINVVQSRSKIIFEKYLEFLLKAIVFFSPFLRLLKAAKKEVSNLPQSFDEYLDQLSRLSSSTLNFEQRSRVESVLLSQQKTVKDIMTPKKKVISIEPMSTLGPIVLSDLQKTKHSYFLVLAKKGEPEGVLKLSDLGDINQAKRSTLAKDFMSSRLAYVEADAPLDQLIQIFLQEKEYLIIVKDADGKYAGIVTLADIMRSLIGIVEQ